MIVIVGIIEEVSGQVVFSGGSQMMEDATPKEIEMADQFADALEKFGSARFRKAQIIRRKQTNA